MRVWNAGDTLYAADLNANFANPEFVTAEFRNAGNSRLVAYDIGASKLKYSVAGVTVFSVGDSGELGASFTATNTTTLRTLADRAADVVNVKNFGAALNSTTNDGAAFNATAAAAIAGGGNVVSIPAGSALLTGITTPAGPILWRAEGTTTNAGGLLAALPGVVQNWFHGDASGRISTRRTVNTSFSDYATAEYVRSTTHTGGTTANIAHNLIVDGTVGSGAGNQEWNFQSRIANNSANAMAVASFAQGNQAVRAVAGTTQGTIVSLSDYRDLTGTADPVGPSVSFEFDIEANGTDLTAGSIPGTTQTGYRTFMHASMFTLTGYGSTAPAEAARGLWFSGVSGASHRLYTGILFTNLDMNTALDTSYATFSTGGPAIKLAAGQMVDFNGNVSPRTLGYVTADTALEYKKSGTTLWSVSDSGVMSASALATGGTTARTLAAIFADQNNVKSFGAVGDGTTVDLAALTGTTMPAYIPKGVFNTGAAFGNLNPSGGIRRWFAGSGGNILTSEGPQAGNIMFVKAAPSYPGPGTSITNMFNGSMQNHLGFQTYIAGTATLGQPTTGYVVNPAVASILGAIYNTSGWNNSTDTASGRTGMHGMFFNLQQGGNGDLIGFGVNGIITGVRAGATYFLGSPVVGVINGDIKAGVDNCYLDPAEIFCRDQGFQSAAFGMVRNMQRDATVAGGKVSQDWPWAGIFLQSTGATAIDAFFAMTGPAAIGIDFACVSGGFKDTSGNPTNAAATLRAGMRLYGNATNPGSGASGTSQIPSYTTPGTEWLSYETATGWGFVVGSASVFNANATAVTASKNLIRKAATADQSADVYVATAAGSRTIPDGCSWEALTPAATIATFTTTMPAAPIDKQEVWISTTQTITTWTLSPNTGQTINGAPATLAANTSVMFRYNLATAAWFRMV